MATRASLFIAIFLLFACSFAQNDLTYINWGNVIDPNLPGQSTQALVAGCLSSDGSKAFFVSSDTNGFLYSVDIALLNIQRNDSEFNQSTGALPAQFTSGNSSQIGIINAFSGLMVVPFNNSANPVTYRILVAGSNYLATAFETNMAVDVSSTLPTPPASSGSASLGLNPRGVYRVDDSNSTIVHMVGSNYLFRANMSDFGNDATKIGVNTLGGTSVDLKYIQNVNNSQNAYILGSDGTIFYISTTTDDLANAEIARWNMQLNGGSISHGYIDEGRSFVYLVGKLNDEPTLWFYNLPSDVNSINGQTVSPTGDALLLASTGTYVTDVNVDAYSGQLLVAINTQSSYGQLRRVDMNAHTLLEPLSFIGLDFDPNLGSSKPSFVWTDSFGSITNGTIISEQRRLFMGTAFDVFSYTFPSSCPNDCSGLGICSFGVCQCDIDHIGSDCSEAACIATDCGASVNQGTCRDGACVCAANWTGAVCDTRRCPYDCSGSGTCDTSTYTCTCDQYHQGEACDVTRILPCEEITDAKNCTDRQNECGFCYSASGVGNDTKCKTGSYNGPASGSCRFWFFQYPRVWGIIAIAIVFIIIGGVLVIINIITALITDVNAVGKSKSELAANVRSEWWRDERSSYGWAFFEQMQVMSYVVVVAVVVTTRVISFCSFFNWTNFILPIPGYRDRAYHAHRVTLNIEQFANSMDGYRPHPFYACMVWGAIAIIGLTALCALVLFIISLIKKDNARELFTARVIHFALRILVLWQFPAVLFAAAHTVQQPTTGALAGSIIALIVFGLGVPALAFWSVWNKKKELFDRAFRVKFGVFFSQFHYKQAMFAIVPPVKRTLLAMALGFMVGGYPHQLPLNPDTAPGSPPVVMARNVAIGQAVAFGIISIAYIVALILRKPFLDKGHLAFDIGITIVNMATIACALIYWSRPNPVGEIVFAILQIISVLLCLGFFINAWLLYANVHSCSQLCGKKEKN